MKWQPIETAPKDGESVLIFTTCHGVCEARFDKGYWSDDTHISPREYYGDAWICCDDAFEIDVELGSDIEHHGTATHWMPLPPPPEVKQ